MNRQLIKKIRGNKHSLITSYFITYQLFLLIESTYVFFDSSAVFKRFEYALSSALCA